MIMTVVLRKEVVNRAEAEILLAQVESWASNHPAIKVSAKTTDDLESDE